jgi:hypothetical protein
MVDVRVNNNNGYYQLKNEPFKTALDYNTPVEFWGAFAVTRDSLLRNPDKIEKSAKSYDWLGHGMYFRENNTERALQWAKDKKSRGGN